jgi:hypothetical protein
MIFFLLFYSSHILSAKAPGVQDLGDRPPTLGWPSLPPFGSWAQTVEDRW